MSGGASGTRLGAALTLVFLAAAASAGAHEMEPRAYAPKPTGGDVQTLAVAWQYLWF